MRRRLLVAATLVLAALSALPAAADIVAPALVSLGPAAPAPAGNTPHVLDGSVRAIAVMAGTVLVGGDFSEVSDASGQVLHRRHGIFAYELGTGRILNFAPRLDGPVYALAAGPDATVYAGGAFRTVNGVPQPGITQLSVETGARVPTFGASLNHGDVRALAVHGSALYAGGTFTKIGGAYRVALARLSSSTGAADPSFDLGLAAPGLSGARVQDLALSPDGARLVAVGAIEQAGGQYRAQLVVVDTAGPGRIRDWHTDAYTRPCRDGFESSPRAVDFSPDGRYFVVVTTGRLTGPGLTCDTAARFETAGTGPHRPTWVNHTGGDPLYAVSITEAAVYVGGYQRWMDNPGGRESPGPGAVRRSGIAALDPVTGKVNHWNPIVEPGAGVRALAATPEGLIVGSDTEPLDAGYHGRLVRYRTA